MTKCGCKSAILPSQLICLYILLKIAKRTIDNKRQQKRIPCKFLFPGFHSAINANYSHSSPLSFYPPFFGNTRLCRSRVECKGNEEEKKVEKSRRERDYSNFVSFASQNYARYYCLVFLIVIRSFCRLRGPKMQEGGGDSYARVTLTHFWRQKSRDSAPILFRLSFDDASQEVR